MQESVQLYQKAKSTTCPPATQACSTAACGILACSPLNDAAARKGSWGVRGVLPTSNYGGLRAVHPHDSKQRKTAVSALRNHYLLLLLERPFLATSASTIQYPLTPCLTKPLREASLPARYSSKIHTRSSTSCSSPELPLPQAPPLRGDGHSCSL